MAKTKDEILQKVKEICAKRKWNLSDVTLIKFSEKYVKLFDNDDDEETIFGTIEERLEDSYHAMSGGMAAQAAEFKKKELEFQTEITKLKGVQNPNPTPPDNNDDKAKLWEQLGYSADEVKEMLSDLKAKKAKEQADLHTSAVIEKALANVPEGHKENLKKFSKGRTFSGELDTDATELSTLFLDFIKEAPDIQTPAGGGGGKPNESPNSSIYDNFAAGQGYRKPN